MDYVELERCGMLGVIRLNRPKALNAVNEAMSEQLAAALDEFESNDCMQVGVLTSSGSAFCAGADLRALADLGMDVSADRGGFFGAFVCQERTKPMVAAVEGAAVGGGFELVLACDLVVASTTARFSLPDVRRCLVAGAGGVLRLSEFLPRNVALDLLLTCRFLEAQEASRWGLVNRLVEPGHAEEVALELAREVSRGAPLALRATRRLFDLATRGDDEPIWQETDEALVSLTRTTDFQEGVSAFLAKRVPAWLGR
ncbi:enoyl-CoA hydratase-related protein [Mycobacterium vicinigordonae]|uniref:Enoyl-CoA hydratase/isomerase family protein n=1 Tax=Mycobacterium vicinigordonae TaxID=1719132 RepID=A0A7D6E077_9MYCO|nr:enoyl-CoA hydratase-related protein [Mycobacterium vicinigordonae]QLL08728.1 enoyl-CoA hydratase/isomerase family protein [Mycobacterium vicinigordonae]